MAAPMVKTKTPGIYKRGGRYVFSYRVDGKQVWESCRTLDEARRAKSARHTDIGRGEFSPSSRVTLHDYARGWIERYQGTGKRGFRDETRIDYRRHLERYALRYFPERRRLTEITPSDMAGFVGWLCDPKAQAKLAHDIAVEQARPNETRAPQSLSPDATRPLADDSVRRIVAPLRTCLSSAVREGLIRHNPAMSVALPNRPTVQDDDEDDVRVLGDDELDTLLRVLPDRWHPFFHLLAVSGLRISEAIALQWRHVELDGSSPHVKVRRRIVNGQVGAPKSRYARRDVPIPHELVVELRGWHAQSEWPGDDHPVFPSGTGTPLMAGNLSRRVLKPAAEEAGIPWVGFHTFRHTCASRLFRAGRNAVQVQRWLGHHSPAFTLSVYVHLLDDDLGGALSLEQGANKVRTSPTAFDGIPAAVETADLP